MTVAAKTKQRAFAVWWRDMERWVIPSALFLRQKLPAGWTRVRIGTLVKQVTTRVKTQPDTEYKMAGVRWYGEGVFHRETVRGDAMSASYVTPLVVGALIYNRLFAWKASFAVVPPELADCYVSGEFPQFIPDLTRVMPEYLYLYCTREATIQAVTSASTGSSAVSRNRFKEKEFLDFEIALPPMTEQNAIVARWSKARNEIVDAKRRVASFEVEISTSVVNALGLKRVEACPDLPKAIALWWKDMILWDAKFNRLPDNNSTLLKSGRYSSVRLGDVAYINPSTVIPDIKNEPVAFVPMEAVSDSEGKIVSCRLETFTKVAKGYTRFQENDVLWAKITPCMQNGKSAVARNLKNGFGFGSTEFHIIRARDTESILPDYIWVLLRMKSVRKLAQKYFVGSAGQQRVPSNFLEDLVIPLPPLSVQREIMVRVAAGRDEIARETAKAERLSREISAEIEALILGTKKIGA